MGLLAQALESFVQSLQFSGLSHRLHVLVGAEHHLGLLQGGVKSDGSLTSEVVHWQVVIGEFGDLLSHGVEVSQVLNAHGIGLWQSHLSLDFIRQEWKLLGSEVLHLTWSWDVMVVVDIVSTVWEDAITNN